MGEGVEGFETGVVSDVGRLLRKCLDWVPPSTFSNLISFNYFSLEETSWLYDPNGVRLPFCPLTLLWRSWVLRRSHELLSLDGDPFPVLMTLSEWWLHVRVTRTTSDSRPGDLFYKTLRCGVWLILWRKLKTDWLRVPHG